MSATLTLHLLSAARSERIEAVTSFVGRDASGSFGILPGHAPLLAVLDYGIARVRVGDGDWHYIACPGGVLRLAGDELELSTRRYLRDDDHARLSLQLSGVLAHEEAELRSVKENLQRLEQELYRRLHRIERWRA